MAGLRLPLTFITVLKCDDRKEERRGTPDEGPYRIKRKILALTPAICDTCPSACLSPFSQKAAPEITSPEPEKDVDKRIEIVTQMQNNNVH
jgi:hypothetical protein